MVMNVTQEYIDMLTKNQIIFQKDVGTLPLKRKYWPYQVTIGWNKIDEAERFCYNNFKSRNWRNFGAYFGFKRKEDCMWFELGCS